jgi:hypothetical protein
MSAVNAKFNGTPNTALGTQTIQESRGIGGRSTSLQRLVEGEFMIEITLPAGTVVKIKGIPVELVTDTKVKTTESNAGIIGTECPDCCYSPLTGHRC